MQGLRRYLVIVLAWMIAFGLAAPLAAIAQTGGSPGDTQVQPKIDKRKLIVPPRNPDGSLVTTPFWESPTGWLKDQQRVFSEAMSGAMNGINGGSPLTAAMTLMFLSFGYGVFHAAGPGHGKAVISTWLLATGQELRRGILIAFMSAIVQALTAISIVTAVLWLTSSVKATTFNVANVTESASYALIGFMGLWLIWSALRQQAQVEPALVGGHHAHGHGDHSGHHHAHQHEEACDCGHSHFPTAREVKGEWSWSKASSLAFAVGIRPCTGAILALIFANLAGIYWAGIASTLVMALGTALTVSVIAGIAVYSRKLAMKLAARDQSWLNRVAFGLKLAGGTVIAALGAILFWASGWTTQTMM